MRIPRPPHRWDVSPSRAIEIQRSLAGRIRRTKPAGPLRCVAGIDVAFTRDGRACLAAAVLWDAEAQATIEQRVATRPLTFPYVPGLLSFREAPAALAALRKLATAPDALMCDGQGIAHPRRFGLACHVGLIADLPTLGCAKSRLCGEHRRPGWRRGSKAALTHEGEVVGTVLRTRDDVRPLYVSIGHRVDLATAERLVLACAVRYRLPEPTRLADRLVAAVRRGGPQGQSVVPQNASSLPHASTKVTR
jgi:deoxyribonuclease V